MAPISMARSDECCGALYLELICHAGRPIAREALQRPPGHCDQRLFQSQHEAACHWLHGLVSHGLAF